eukprot:4103626-Amphidinium_carterae.1
MHKDDIFGQMVQKSKTHPQRSPDHVALVVFVTEFSTFPIFNGGTIPTENLMLLKHLKLLIVDLHEHHLATKSDTYPVELSAPKPRANNKFVRVFPSM